MKKDKTIESLRGIAILLVVVGHVIGSASDGGMKVQEDSLLRYIYHTLVDPIQMPMFTILAGWVYSLRPIKCGFLKSVITKKIYRLLVPMLAVGSFYFIIQYFTPNTNHKWNLSEIWKLLIFPYTTFWYLYALFLVFIVVAFLDISRKMETINSWLCVFCISIIVLLLRDSVIPTDTLNYFSYKGALYLLPSFLLGLGLNRFEELLEYDKTTSINVILLLICVVIQQLSWFDAIDFAVRKDTIIGLLIGFTFTILLLKSKLQTIWLVWLGGLSYTIYLFHGFGTAAGRIISLKFDISNTSIIFIISLATGIVFPIFVDRIFEKFKITRILFLGKS
ncbi:MAG: acyltransferase family protein [Jejuia sp.]